MYYLFKEEIKRGKKRKVWWDGERFGPLEDAKELAWITVQELAVKKGLDSRNVLPCKEMVEELKLQVGFLQGQIFSKNSEIEILKRKVR